MIPAAGIQDQELPIAAKRSGVNHPSVAWGGNLGSGPGGDRDALLGPADAIGPAERADWHAIDRQMHVSAHVGEGDRGGQAAGVAESRELRLCRVVGNSVGGIVRRAGRGIEAGFELGDQILDRIDLARQDRGVLPLGIERLFRGSLVLLALVNKERQSKLLVSEQS